MVEDIVDDVYFESLLNKEIELEKLGSDLNNIQTAFTAVETYGINPTTLYILKSNYLLSSTAYDKVALETFPIETQGGAESNRALEALSENFKHKAAQWSAKILSITTVAAGKLWTMVETMGGKLKSFISDLGEKAWDSSKSIGKEVKAHPYKSCVVVVAAIAAVASIMIYSASNLPGAGQSRQVYKAFADKIAGMINKIPSPFGKVAATVDDASRFRVDVVFPSKSASSIPVEKLGWNYQAAKAIGTHVDKTISSLKRGFSVFGTKLYSAAGTAGKSVFKTADNVKKSVPKHVYNLTGSKEAAHASAFAAGGIYYGMMISLTYAVWRLVKKIVIGGMHLIYSSIKSVFS